MIGDKIIVKTIIETSCDTWEVLLVKTPHVYYIKTYSKSLTKLVLVKEEEAIRQHTKTIETIYNFQNFCGKIS